MQPFAVLADPVRRRIVEVLAGGEKSAGEIVDAVGGEFGIGQSAVSQQLRVLKESGFAQVATQGRRRIYSLDPAPLLMVDGWLAHYRRLWETSLDELSLEVARAKAERMASRERPS